MDSLSFWSDCKEQEIDSSDDETTEKPMSTEYETVQRNCLEVLSKISKTECLEVFNREFKTMMRALHVSHISLNKLKYKCQYQKAIINCNNAKLDAHKELTVAETADKSVLITYDKKGKKTWKKVYEAADEERRYQNIIDKLCNDIKELTKAVNDMDMQNIGNKAIKKLVVKRELIEEQRVHILEENNQLRIKIDEQKSLIADMNNDTLKLEETKANIVNQFIENDVLIKKNEATNSIIKENIDEIQVNIKELNKKIEDKTSNMKTIEDSLPMIMEVQEKLKAEIETYLQQISRVNEKIDAVSPDMLSAEKNCSNLEEEIERIKNNIKNLSADIESLKPSVKACRVWIGQKNELIAKCDKERIENEHTRQNLMSKSWLMSNRKTKIAHDRNSSLKNIDLITNELGDAQRQLFKSKIVKEKKRALLKSYKLSETNLRRLIRNHEIEIAHHENSIVKIVKEIDQFNVGIDQYHMKLGDTLELLKSSNSDILSLKNHIAEEKVRLEEQKKMYEVVRKDYAFYYKRLFDVKTQTRDLQLQQKIMTFQLLHLDCESAHKVLVFKDILKERYKVEQDSKRFDNILTNLEDNIEANKKFTEAQFAEEQQILKTLLVADQEKLRRKIQLDEIVNERDFLITNHCRQNEKMTKVLKALTNQSNLIQRCEKEFSDLIDKAEEYRVKLVKIFAEKRTLIVQLTNEEEIRHCIMALTSNLIRNKTYIQFVREDLAMPINVHRWTLMQNNYNPDWRKSSYLPESVGRCPFMYESIMRRNSLLRRVNQRTLALQKRQEEIEAKQRIYQSYAYYKNWRAAPEVHEQICIHQQALIVKRKELKMMDSELRTQEDMVHSLKFDLIRINRDVSHISEHYFNYCRQLLRQSMMEKQGKRTDPVLIPQLTLESTSSLSSSLMHSASVSRKKSSHQHRKINLSIKSYKQEGENSVRSDADVSQYLTVKSKELTEAPGAKPHVTFSFNEVVEQHTIKYDDLTLPSPHRLLRPVYLKDEFHMNLP